MESALSREPLMLSWLAAQPLWAPAPDRATAKPKEAQMMSHHWYLRGRVGLNARSPQRPDPRGKTRSCSKEDTEKRGGGGSCEVSPKC